ncbi:MAG: LysR family transcriptional regulator [Proteobacteria bacterium]|nr:MAG: LysR family transcriptional regulator [Pseudomonadota bacterium]
MNRFDELTAFVKVVEAGTFTAAAAQMGVAKSAVSRRIADLESRLGAQLFRRTTRKLSLTDSGRGLYERGKRILEDLEEAEARVSSAQDELRGRLRMALPMSFGLRHLSPALCDFGNRHPGIDFDIDFNDRRTDLMLEGFDLAVRIGRLEDSSLIAKRLFDARTVVCASPSYLDKHGTPETPEDLTHHSILIYSNVSDSGQWTYRDASGARHRIKLPVVLRANSGEYLAEAAEAGWGIVLQPTFIAHEKIASGDLVPILKGYSWPISPAYAIYPQTRHLSQRVRAFIDFLAERFSGTPYWDRQIRECAKG